LTGIETVQARKLNSNEKASAMKRRLRAIGGDSSYSVGYRKPPIHSRFKSGRSGNPKGRPQGQRNFSTDVEDVLKRMVVITRDGKQQKVSTQMAGLLRLVQQALGGNIRALERLLDLAGAHNREPPPKGDIVQEDAEIIDSFLKRSTREAAADKLSKAAGNSSTNQFPDDEEAAQPGKVKRIRAYD
jgi:hypothetical protein